MAKPRTDMPLTDDQHRACGKALFNHVWTLLEKPQRTAAEDDEMVHACHAMHLHWSKVGEPVNFARAEWQLSRVYSVLGRAEPALHHATRCLEICREHAIGDFDLAFAHEALARAHAVAGNLAEARRHVERAEEAGKAIADEEDRQLLVTDLATISGAGREE